MSLLNNGIIGTVRLCCQFRLMHLQVEPLEALNTCHELTLGYFHNHRSSASCCNSLTMSQNSRMAKTSSVVTACSCQFEHIWKVSNSFSTPCALCRSASCRLKVNPTFRLAMFPLMSKKRDVSTYALMKLELSIIL